MSNKLNKLNTQTQMYKNIPLKIIVRKYTNYNAKRFRINNTNQNVWIPNKHLAPDGTILPDQNLDYIFFTPTGKHKLNLAGITI